MTLLFAFEPDQIVMIAMTFVLAGMVKGVTGMGLPTVAMGILGSDLTGCGGGSAAVALAGQ